MRRKQVDVPMIHYVSSMCHANSTSHVRSASCGGRCQRCLIFNWRSELGLKWCCETMRAKKRILWPRISATCGRKSFSKAISCHWCGVDRLQVSSLVSFLPPFVCELIAQNCALVVCKQTITSNKILPVFRLTFL